MTENIEVEGRALVAKPAGSFLSVVVYGLWIVALAGSAALMFLDIPNVVVGGATLLLLLVYLVIGLPIGVALIVASLVCMAGVTNWRLAEISLQTSVFTSVSSWSFVVIPLFVLMGTALWTSGLTTKAYDAARVFTGRLPGGLATSTTFAGAALAASSGSSMAIVMSLGRMAIPEMLKSGYSPALATGSVAVVGTLGQIIPPSILLVIYAGLAETPIGPQLMAALVPGLLLSLSYVAVITIWALVSPSSAPPANLGQVTSKMKMQALIGLLPVILVIIVVLGGMFAGIFTATEASAVGAVVALLVGWLSMGKQARNPRSAITYLVTTIQETVNTIAGLFLILVGAFLITGAMARSGLTQQTSEWILSLGLDATGLLFALIVLYLVLGMFLESLPMILLTVPIFQAALEALGIDMIWFGVFLVIVCELGLVFPPIGIITFIVHKMTKDPRTGLGHDIALGTVFKGIMPFVGAALVILALLILFPSIAMWLPSISSSR
jgi:tripartite ATP-independent transporter DctM subunit